MSSAIPSGLGAPGLLLSVTVAASLMSSAGVAAEPCTLYKPQDIQNARENIERYPWAQVIVADWKSRVRYALEHDRQAVQAMISDLTPGRLNAQNCPACVGKQSVMGENDLFAWRISSPDRVVCGRCGTVYPNPEYPETGRIACRHMGQAFTYYETEGERAHPDERAKYAMRWNGRPVPTSFSGMIRFGKCRWAVGAALPLAKLYAVTNDVRYAERAAWILDRFATVFPHYLYHSYDGTIADCPPAEAAANMGKHGGGGHFPKDVIVHPYGNNQFEDHATLYNGFWGAGRYNAHGKGSDSGPLLDMAVAYDLIRDARYPDGRPVIDATAEKRIVNDLLIAGCADYENWDDVTNKGVASRSLSAAVGVVLQRPESVHRALDGLNLILDSKYHLDGFFTESPAYAEHNYENVRELPDILLGYSDPPGYQPKQGPRLENLNPYADERFRLALLSMVRMLTPGNRLPVIGDTRHEARLPVIFAEILADRLGDDYVGLLETAQGIPLARKGSEYALWYRPVDLQAPAGRVALPLRSEWFPGWHVGVLRGGREANDTALYLTGDEEQWIYRSGHRHRNILGILYYAFGKEIVSDRGYFSGSREQTPDGRFGQEWMNSTLSHNLVVVDEKSQSMPRGSHLELFGVAPGVEVVQASGFNAYPQCQEYRRTTALIRTPDGQTYAVDFFRVRGGQTHQYSFHCNGSLVGVAPAQPAPQPVDLSKAWSAWLSHARAITPGGPHRFTWQDEGTRLDLLLLNGPDDLKRIVVADAPGWRKAGIAEFEKPPIQQILAENRADDPEEALATQYAAVIVPYQGAQSPVLAARLLANDRESGTMAIEVRFADRTDTVISTKDQQERRFGAVSAAGEFAFMSVDGHGKATRGYLLNGTRLERGGLEVRLPQPSAPLRVKSVEGRTFHLAEPLPEGVAVPGSYLLAPGPVERHPTLLAYRASVNQDADPLPRPQTGFEVESTTADTITVRDYPPCPCEEVVILNSRWVSVRP
ncbi:MAG: heparinase II/III family protein [Armatimonadetes bacterium]|nr:heparinase II/III family protein [Armatimonadota bacterium]